MTKAASNAAKKAPAKRRAKAVATPPPVATAAIQARREFAVAPDRAASIHAENQVLLAVQRCRPGMKSGARSELWELGLGAIYDAARWYLIDHEPVATIHARLHLPATKLRALHRLLDNIKDAHTAIMAEELEQRDKAAAMAPMDGDLAGLGIYWLTQLVRSTVAVVSKSDWDDVDASERNNRLRLAELVSDAVKTAGTLRHKEAQTERLERMLRQQIEDEAAKQGDGTLGIGAVRSIVDQVFGLASPAQPAPAEGGAA